MTIDNVIKALQENGISDMGQMLNFSLPFMPKGLLREYLDRCLSIDGFDASGIGFLGVRQLERELIPESVPGGSLLKYGYILIATSIGGNAVVVDSATDLVYWAERTNFSGSMRLCWKDPGSAEYIYGEWTVDNVKTALIDMDYKLDDFIMESLSGKLEDRLDELDTQ